MAVSRILIDFLKIVLFLNCCFVQIIAKNLIWKHCFNSDLFLSLSRGSCSDLTWIIINMNMLEEKIYGKRSWWRSFCFTLLRYGLRLIKLKSINEKLELIKIVYFLKFSKQFFCGKSNGDYDRGLFFASNLIFLELALKELFQSYDEGEETVPSFYLISWGEWK